MTTIILAAGMNSFAESAAPMEEEILETEVSADQDLSQEADLDSILAASDEAGIPGFPVSAQGEGVLDANISFSSENEMSMSFGLKTDMQVSAQMTNDPVAVHLQFDIDVTAMGEKEESHAQIYIVKNGDKYEAYFNNGYGWDYSETDYPEDAEQLQKLADMVVGTNSRLFETLKESGAQFELVEENEDAIVVHTLMNGVQLYDFFIRYMKYMETIAREFDPNTEEFGTYGMEDLPEEITPYLEGITVDLTFCLNSENYALNSCVIDLSNTDTSVFVDLFRQFSFAGIDFEDADISIVINEARFSSALEHQEMTIEVPEEIKQAALENYYEMMSEADE